METRKKNVQLMKVLYDVVGFTDEQVTYLIEKRSLRSPSALVQAYWANKMSSYEDEKFPDGEVLTTYPTGPVPTVDITDYG